MQGKRIKGVYDGELSERRWRDIEVGGYSGGLITTRYPDNLLHEGYTFRYWKYRTLEPGETKSYIFRTHLNWVHLFWRAYGIYDCVIKTFGFAEVSDYKTMLGMPPITNGNHNIDRTTAVEIYPNATITNDGTLFSTWRWGMEDMAEAILAPNINYHLQYKNKHSEKNYINLTSAWFEQKPKFYI